MVITALPRVEYDSDGHLGLLVESSGTNIAIQARPLCDLAYADVGTPACTANSTTGPWGTTTMARITDDNAAAAEGRSQNIATTSATRFTAHCYVKGGTATSATFNLLGTGSALGDCGATVTGLSTTTSTIIECTSGVAYAGTLTSVQLLLRIGTVVADTGTLFVEGCDVKASSPGYRTSLNETAGAAVARAGEVPYFVVSGAWASGSMAATVRYLGGGGDRGWLGLNAATFRTFLYQATPDSVQLYVDAANRAATVTTPGSNRLAGYWGAAGVGVSGGGAFTTAAGVSETGSPSNFDLLTYNQNPALTQDGIISRVCLDPSPPRCR